MHVTCMTNHFIMLALWSLASPTHSIMILTTITSHEMSVLSQCSGTPDIDCAGVLMQFVFVGMHTGI